MLHKYLKHRGQLLRIVRNYIIFLEAIYEVYLVSMCHIMLRTLIRVPILYVFVILALVIFVIFCILCLGSKFVMSLPN